MAAEVLETTSHAIVLLGTFEPSLGQPKTLYEKGLLREGDLLDLTVEAMLPELCSLTLSWLSFSIERNRIIATTTVTSPLVEPVLDFVLGLVEDMEGASVTAFGVNEDRHFQVKDMATLHSIGHRLAPKDFLWDNLFPQPGMLDLTVQGAREDDFPGFVRVTVQPSFSLPTALFVQVNDHFASDSNDNGKKSKALLQRLENEAPKCFKRSMVIIDALKALQDE